MDRLVEFINQVSHQPGDKVVIWMFVAIFGLLAITILVRVVMGIVKITRRLAQGKPMFEPKPKSAQKSSYRSSDTVTRTPGNHWPGARDGQD